ncbi:hypothetical protein ACJMK2_043090 [Sinanodonta woodiana]|uniref:15-hydroxyprostaglandin dehydrogenase [NAD(+)] n=1 Tax=Sinanodonta woodiana TaxID=1069815 RepID=A0ABD3VVW5_SINWO
MKVVGKVAVITGGARGFGKAFSEALLKRGAKVCFSDIDVSGGQQSQHELAEKFGENSVHFVKCDVTKEEEFRDLFRECLSKFKKINIMVNNAGILDEARWEKSIDVNMTAMMRGTYLALEKMNPKNGGEGGIIINVSSAAGLYPAHFLPAYVATKHGILGFTRSLAMDPLYQSQGIQLASLCPAFTSTNMLTEAIHGDAGGRKTILYPDLAKTIIEKLGICSVADITDAFIELVEKENCNGDVLMINKKIGKQYQFVNKTTSRL